LAYRGYDCSHLDMRGRQLGSDADHRSGVFPGGRDPRHRHYFGVLVMSDDIVEQLRTADIYDVLDADKLCCEAAVEIEKLRAALQTSRRDALKEAAQMASNRAAAWAEDAIGKYLETKWDYESRAEAGEEIASAILARAVLGEKQ